MSTDRDTTRIVRSWLEEGVTVLPDPVLDAVLDQLPTTPQRRTWWPARRFPHMNNTVKIALATAAVVVVAFLGIRYLLPGQNIGPPGPTPTPIPTATPAALPAGGPVPAGTYVIGPNLTDTWLFCLEPDTPACSNGLRILFTVPDGWAAISSDVVLAEEGSTPPGGAGMIVHRGEGLYSDPCRNPDTGLPEIEVGPTVDDFANALADHPLLDVTTPVDVTLAGYSGKYMDLQVPSDISQCVVYRIWDEGLYAQGPGHQWHLWILDVDGQRVVVMTSDYEGTSQEHQAELQAIVDSIQIEP